MAAKKISLADLQPADDTGAANLTSPRSIVVCMREGIDPESLKFKKLETFDGPNVSEALAKMCYEHHEAIRQERLKALLEARESMDPNNVEVPAFLKPKKQPRSLSSAMISAVGRRCSS